MIIGTIGTIT